LANLDDTRLVKEAYLLDRSRSGLNKSTWYDTIKFLLKELKLENSSNCHTKTFYHKKAFAVAKKHYEGCWLNLINRQHSKSKLNAKQGSKMRTYCKFKVSFEKENYFEIKNTEYRKCLTKFRISNHKLDIETGRYYGIPAENRLCKLCNSNAIEDEEHFLMDCTQYNTLRTVLFKKIHQVNESFNTMSKGNQFIWIMMSKVPSIMKASARFIKEAMYSREKSLVND
jgi:hypothetical protein